MDKDIEIRLTALQKLQNSGMQWAQDHLWNIDMAVQTAVILLAFGIGFFVHRVLSPYLKTLIDKAPVRWRTKQILGNLTKLTRHVVTTLFMAMALQLVASPILGEHNTGFLQAIIALLIAWIVIRIALQFIENTALRNLFALTIWIIAALEIVGVREQTMAALDAAGVNIGDFRLSALTITKGVIAVFALLYMAMATSSLIEQRIKYSTSLTPSAKVLVGKTIRIILITFALIIGLTAAGFDLSLFAVLSGAIGLGIGFGLQKVISNLFSGMLLLMDKSIKPGDILELPGNIFGWVAHMGARYTEIVTRDNKSYLIPNEDFVTQRVVNWSHGDTLVRIDVDFGVDYRENPHRIKALAEQAALSPARVVAEPNKPLCHMTAFGESSLDFTLRFWIKDAQEGVTNVRGEVLLSLWDSFKENDVKIPYPHREIYIHDVPEQPKPTPPKKKTTKKAS